MNDIVKFRTPTATAGTLAVVGLTAAIASGQFVWPNRETPVYVVPNSSSSFSPFIEKLLTFAPNSAKTEFAREIAKFYATLSEGQEPLGAEFEAVWDANVDSLYES